MKTGIHPEIYDVVFVDVSSGAQFITESTVKSEETVKIDGKEYYVIKVDISSDTHPFYTGKQKLVDTAGRVEKFMAKMKKAQAHAEKNVKVVDEDEEEEVAEVTEAKAPETILEAPVEKVAEEVVEAPAEEAPEVVAEEAANDDKEVAETEEAAETPEEPEAAPEEEKAAA
jgi:large subunit ribosomal protein L31